MDFFEAIKFRRSIRQYSTKPVDENIIQKSFEAAVLAPNSSNAPKPVHVYYQKFIPITYTWGILNSLAPVKWIIAQAIGLVRPFMKGPFTRRDLQEVAIKSAALASENFVLALAAQGVYH